MDDRMGVAILLQVLAELPGITPPGTVQAVVRFVADMKRHRDLDFG